MQRQHSAVLRAVPPYDPHAARVHTREHALLAMFLGTWHVEGSNAPTAPVHPDRPVFGDAVYTWLPGEFFVLGRWNHRIGGDSHIGTSLMGFDPDRRAYFAHHYDNLGYARDFVLAPHGTAWTFASRYDRASYVFDDARRSFLVRWELSADGTTWRPLCELRGTRLD